MPATPPPEATHVYTHLQASGNRVISGRGDINGLSPVDITVEGDPAWLLAAGDTASHWTVVTATGRATTHRVSNGTSERVGDHGQVPTRPLGYMADGAFGFVEEPDECGEYTHPVVVDDGLLYVAKNGDVVIWRGDSTTRLDVSAPADARPIRLDESRYAVYGDRTDRYKHAALGDSTEGSSLVIVDSAAERVAVETSLEEPTVFEGLSPLAADIDGDGEPELVTTIADSARGARIRVYGADGAELATGPNYGPGWRHQLCVAPAGPSRVPELAVVRKPHVDFTVEFYRLAAGELDITATQQGYASHTYGSRNVDGGLAADLDSDGVTELLVPTASQYELEAIRRVAGTTVRAWSLQLDGELVTNVTGVELDDGRIAVGAGTADGVRVWQR